MGAARKLTNEFIADRLDQLPTLPTVIQELNKVINDPMSSASDVEKVMEQDQSLTAKVLKLINSAHYAIPGGVSNLSRAIAYLGFDTVHQVVLSASIFKALKVENNNSFDIKQFWQHSIGVGMAAETLAQYVKHPTPSDLFTCGLIHDMGKVALFVIEPNELVRICAHAQQESLSVHEAELELNSVSHTHIGQLLAERWNLPGVIQNAIKYHHEKDHLRRGGISAEHHQVVDITMLANLLVHALKYGHSGHEKIVNAPVDLFERLHIKQEKLKDILTKIKSSLETADSFIRLVDET